MKDNGISSKSIVFNLGWSFFETIGVQFVAFVVQIILARLLEPEMFGVVGLVTVFNTIAMVFIQSGFSTALIQKKQIDQEECSSVFYTSFLISVLIYLILFFCAPLVADFYDYEVLTPIIRVQYIGLLFAPIRSIQGALLQKNMQFKLSFIRSAITSVTSGIIGVAAAYMGYGIWALVIYNLASNVLSAIILTITVRWLPSLMFSLSKVKRLFSFGWKLLVSGLIDTIYNNIYTLVIGKLFNKSDLGYYSKGKNFPNTAVNALNGTIQSVIFPALSKCQDDKVQFKALMRRSIKTSTFLVFPAMAGLAATATPLITILLTEKWLPAVFFMQMCCYSYAFWPIQTANVQAINAVGRSDIFLKLELIKKAVGIISLVVTVPFGLKIMVSSRLVTSIISCFINAYPNKKLLNYSFFEQMKDILPAAILAMVMCGAVLLIGYLPINTYLLLLIQFISGAAIYIGGAFIFKFESFSYLIQLIKSLLQKNKAQ